jgi:hypothetical protein
MLLCAQSLHLLFAATVQNLGTERHSRFFPSSPLIQSLYYYGPCVTAERRQMRRAPVWHPRMKVARGWVCC